MLSKRLPDKEAFCVFYPALSALFKVCFSKHSLHRGTYEQIRARSQISYIYDSLNRIQSYLFNYTSRNIKHLYNLCFARFKIRVIDSDRNGSRIGIHFNVDPFMRNSLSNIN